MTRHIPSSFFLIGLATSLACSGEERSDNSSVIVSGAFASGALSIDATPSLVVPADTTDDRALIGHAVDATRLSDGMILVADGYEPSLRAYDQSGRFQRSIGRRGGGPGEFESIVWFGQCAPDSLFTWDGGLARLSVFDSHGRFARETRLPGSSAIISCSRSGKFASLLAPEPMTHLPTDHDPRVTTRLRLFDAQGDSLWSLPDIGIGDMRPLGTIPRIALHDDRLYVGTRDSAFVDEYDLHGQRIATFRVGEAPRASTMHHYERAIDRLLGQLPGTPKDRETAKKMMLTIPMPQHLPPYIGLLVDPTGTLWVVTSVPGDETTEIRAFAPSGEELGRIHLPVEVRVFEIGSDYLLGAYAAPDGQELVALYRYRRAEIR
jgi:hypothetical protein